MGIPDSSLTDLLQKVRSCISWGASDLTPSYPLRGFEMPNTGAKMCSECDANSSEFCFGYHCQSCGRWLCAKCVNGYEYNSVKRSVDIDESVESSKACKFCNGVTVKRGGVKKNSEKVYPSESPRESPEPPSPSFSGESVQCDHLAHSLESCDRGCSSSLVTSQSMTSLSFHPAPATVYHSSSRSDEEEGEDSGKHYHGPLCEYCHDMSDIDSSSVSPRLEFYSCKPVGSNPLDSSSRIDFTYKVGHSVQSQVQEESQLSQNVPFDQETTTVLKGTDKRTTDLENNDDYSSDKSILHNKYHRPQKPLDFESNGRIWFPPPPEDENDEAESNFFEYDDDDDDVGDSGAMFSSSSSLSNMFSLKEKQNEGNKEPLRSVINGHFRALVSQLLQGEGIKISKEDNSEDWLDIITKLAWQAANFVKPDTRRGGSMDPGDYVKVKCIASGVPNDSTLVKGIVCTKNIKHKRMTTQCRNPRLLILGGALEYQSVVTSFNTLVQQENDHLKMIMTKIEALRPNVLLVEKTVSPFAQEYLLSKEISLVLNVKKSLLERIGQCTGAVISPSFDNISTSRLGHCELFRVERVTEEHETVNQFNRRPSKTLMFFEGCPRRLGCTVLLRGASREELKKLKHVVQYAVFAAYHLSLETSFLADEGATLPKMNVKPSIAVPETAATDNAISVIPPISFSHTTADGFTGLKHELSKPELSCGHTDVSGTPHLSPLFVDYRLGSTLSDAYQDEVGSNVGLGSPVTNQHEDVVLPVSKELPQSELPDILGQEMRQHEEAYESTKSERIDEDEIPGEHFSAADSYQSILVAFSSRHIHKGTVCERSRLLRIKFYGSFDKPLGRYLRDDLFDQTSFCRSCNEPAEAHVLCYTHQQGNLTINVRSLSSVNLPGERDGKIWMWHRCLRCAHIDGVPPATRRVVMSDAAWGLSFGKFLELSFTNHATANRVAPCGHSLQRDCLRFYGFGKMVVFFRYSPVDILNVHLPPSVLEFNGCAQQEWIRKEAFELLCKMETFFNELSDVLDGMQLKSKSLGSELSGVTVFQNHTVELKNQLEKERNEYNAMLQPFVLENFQLGQFASDILELNRLRRSLLIGSQVWDRKLFSLDSLLKTNSVVKSTQRVASSYDLKESLCMEVKHEHVQEENISGLSKSQEFGYDLPSEQETSLSSQHLVAELPVLSSCYHDREMGINSDGEANVNHELFDDIPSDVSNLSDRIDSAWTGTDPVPPKVQSFRSLPTDGFESGPIRKLNVCDNPPVKRMSGPVRVHSFDSALRVQERILKGLPPSSLHLSQIRSFHASGDYRSMVRDPVANAVRTYSQTLPFEMQKLNLVSTSSFVSSASDMTGGARLLLPKRGHSDIVIGVYDDDPASVVSYALSSKEYEDWVSVWSNENYGSLNTNELSKQETSASTFSVLPSYGSTDLDYVRYGSEDPSSIGTLYMDSKRSPHLTISFGDDSSPAGGKLKFSVICYFAKEFDSLRKKCCPSEVDFVRSLSRCQRWSAQGGKSNVYFAKSLDERFIIKQVKKTELESFEEFAPEYFKYLTYSLNSGSPSCLAKILGIYQVNIRHLKGGKETKMDLMVMENLFFKRHVSKVYDLKGSVRSRYNADTSGTNKVLLDMNLVETLCTEPIFLGSKAKRNLERAIWNDTSFLASVDVMDYSLLVGVDEERKELVLGIIDFMRQYTWDKHLETWVKASGLLGGPKNEAPTIISPKQYKKRFRKAMTSYFLTVPDQWLS